jgi:sugar lactone lactonase YvrE
MPATEDRHTDRPYCMLVYDKMSRNFFVCGYSGIDLLEAPQFRKNATDSVHRFDLRSGQWKVVEAHDPRVVPVAALKKDVSSVYYPHHDISKHNPPHGLVNGPCGAVIAGSYLYVGAKDNTALACYDISEIRRNPDAPPPPGHFIFEGTKGHAEVAIEGHGQMVVNGTCALASHGGYLYVAFRTTSQILRFPLQADGSLKQPLKGQYIAQFSRHDPDKGGGSANIYDMTFDGEGRCYVSPGYDGAIYRFQPDPAKPYRADQVDYQPYVDLNALVGAKKSGNICFDDEGNLYICSGQKVLDDSKVRGVIYRVRPR